MDSTLLAEPMPHSEIDRWFLYLDEIDRGDLPAQDSYDGWCDDCYKAEERGEKDVADPDLTTTSTAEVRSFLQLHGDHSMYLWMHYDQEFLDLEPSTRAALRRNVIFRRHWVAAMTDQEIQDLSEIGPKRLKEIRTKIPYIGPPAVAAGVEAGRNAPQLQRCPTCLGTGLSLSDPAREAVAQFVDAVEAIEAESEAARNAAVLMPSIEESLMRLTTTIEGINARLAVLEKDRKVGLSTPRLLMGVDDAAKAVGVRQQEIWDAITEGDLPFFRMGNGFPMVRAEALLEWIRWREVRIEPEIPPYVPPPESLCRRCGTRQYYGRSGQLHLCRECHEEHKQERADEKARKRAERSERKKHHEH